jgi:citrate synthase
LRASIAGLDSAAFGDSASLVGAVAVFAAAHARVSRGSRPSRRPVRGHAAPCSPYGAGEGSEPCARALEAYLVTVMDHGLNASRSQRASWHRPLRRRQRDQRRDRRAERTRSRGRAGPVLDMLDAIGTPDAAAAWLEAELAGGRRIMGMGHRVYRARPACGRPRARARRAPNAPAARRCSSSSRARRAGCPRRAGQSIRPALSPRTSSSTQLLLDAVIIREPVSRRCSLSVASRAGVRMSPSNARGRLIRPASLYDGPR